MVFYVKKFLKSSKATIFWFNNKDFQIVFQDSTEILLRSNQAVYVNKFSERKYFLFADYETMSEEIQKRMRYALEVIQKAKAKPRTASSNRTDTRNDTRADTRNDENKRPPSSIRTGASLKHSVESLKDRNKEKKELPRNSSYGRLGTGHETDRQF